MTPEKLLIPRYKCIAPMPFDRDKLYNVGDVFTDDGITPVLNQHGTPVYPMEWDKYPHLFQRLEWWEERKPEDMPEYVKIISMGCTIEKDGVAKVQGTGFYEDAGRSLGNEGQPYVLVKDEYTEFTRMNCRNCMPATREEYEQYKQKEVNNEQ